MLFICGSGRVQVSYDGSQGPLDNAHVDDFMLESPGLLHDCFVLALCVQTNFCERFDYSLDDSRENKADFLLEQFIVDLLRDNP